MSNALFQDLYCVRSDLGNLLKALGRLDEAKVNTASSQSLVRSEVNRILCNSLLSTVKLAYSLIRDA